ncbi:MAG: hypothetical protein ACRC9G_00230 [Aeromonas veronii]
MNKKTVTGRTPSQPELQSLPGTPTQELVREFVEKFRERYPAVADVAKGSFRFKSPQVQQIAFEDLSKIEHRVLSAPPAFAAPYGQTDKDNADE